MAESLFTSQTPDSSFSDGAPGITTSTTLHFVVDGTITHVRFYASSGVLTGTWTGAVWQVTGDDTGNAGTGTLLGSKGVSAAGISASAWNTIALDTPISVTADTLYRVGLHTPAWYVASNNFFAASGLTNGNILADVRSSSRHQGAFVINAALTYPTAVGSSANYFIDVVFEAAGGAAPGEGAAALGLNFAIAATGAVPPAAGEGAAAFGINFAINAVGSSSPPVAAEGSWWGLKAVLDEAREMRREDDAELANPSACPNDGEPLLTGPGGQLYCPYDGWRP